MKIKYPALGLLIAGAIGIAIWQNHRLQSDELSGIVGVNGRLEFNRLDIQTLYAGRVEEIFVQEGDEIQPGQQLVRLSSTLSQAQVESALAQKQRAEESMARANSEIEVQRQQANIAKLEFDNAVKLRRDNLVSSSEVERRQASYKAAQALITAAEYTKAEAMAMVSQAQAQLASAESQNNDMLIKSPKAGWVEYRVAEVGNVLSVGGKVLSLLDPTDTYINVFLTSTQLNQIRIGDDARIVIDGVDAVLPAKITFASTNSQFTPKAVETNEERTKLMFRVKLQIPVEVSLQNEKWLKGGMRAVGYVKYDQKANWPEWLNVKLPVSN